MDASDSAYPDLHTVVFDVNVYLDVAALVGPPFTWEKFQDLSVQHGRCALPNHPDRRVDSLRAISVCLNGRFAGPEPLEVWTSEHINSLVELKATQPVDGPTPEEQGLGWSAADARDLLIDLVEDLVYDKTEGGAVQLIGIEGRPPLSHEDACVFTTAVGAAQETLPPSIKYCVTRDEQFRKAHGLNPNVTVLFPDEFVAMVRRSRTALAMRTMRTSP